MVLKLACTVVGNAKEMTIEAYLREVRHFSYGNAGCCAAGEKAASFFRNLNGECLVCDLMYA